MPDQKCEECSEVGFHAVCPVIRRSIEEQIGNAPGVIILESRYKELLDLEERVKRGMG